MSTSCPACGTTPGGDPCSACGAYPVLDRGFVRVVEIMGGDHSVVQAARVSYGQGSKGEARDRRLIHYLMMHDHGTPFEMAVFKFHVKAPLFVARQWFRHRIGSFNEISGRYTEYPMEFYVPERLRKPAKDNRQNSVPGGFSGEEEARGRALFEEASRQSFDIYRTLLEMGVARELARIVLPMATYTQYYWAVNARSLMNFLRLRMARDAQWEIRQYAKKIFQVFANRMPWTAEAFLQRHPDLEVEE